MVVFIVFEQKTGMKMIANQVFFGCFVVSTVLVAICGASAPASFCRGSPPSLKNARDNMRQSMLLAMRATRRLHQPSDTISSLRPDVDPVECHSIVKVCVNPCKHFIAMYFDIFVVMCTYICIKFSDLVQIHITHIYKRDKTDSYSHIFMCVEYVQIEPLSCYLCFIHHMRKCQRPIRQNTKYSPTTEHSSKILLKTLNCTTMSLETELM